MNATIERRVVREAYPKNGNPIPTKYYGFGLRVDGQLILSHSYKKSECMEEARDMGVKGRIEVVDVI